MITVLKDAKDGELTETLLNLFKIINCMYGEQKLTEVPPWGVMNSLTQFPHLSHFVAFSPTECVGIMGTFKNGSL